MVGSDESSVEAGEVSEASDAAFESARFTAGNSSSASSAEEEEGLE